MIHFSCIPLMYAKKTDWWYTILIPKYCKKIIYLAYMFNTVYFFRTVSKCMLRILKKNKSYEFLLQREIFPKHNLFPIKAFLTCKEHFLSLPPTLANHYGGYMDSIIFWEQKSFSSYITHRLHFTYCHWKC